MNQKTAFQEVNESYTMADFDSENELTHENIVEKKRGRVAVIGAGPSGITVALGDTCLQ